MTKTPTDATSSTYSTLQLQFKKAKKDSKKDSKPKGPRGNLRHLFELTKETFGDSSNFSDLWKEIYYRLKSHPDLRSTDVATIQSMWTTVVTECTRDLMSQEDRLAHSTLICCIIDGLKNPSKDIFDDVERQYKLDHKAVKKSPTTTVPKPTVPIVEPKILVPCIKGEEDEEEGEGSAAAAPTAAART